MNAILHNSFLDFAEAHGFDVSQELVIDCFAGGGGASEGMEMAMRELARAQGFRESYILAAPFSGGLLTETDQRHKIGNLVCPDMAYALFRRNYRPKPRLVVDNGQGWLFAAPTQRRAAA